MLLRGTGQPAKSEACKRLLVFDDRRYTFGFLLANYYYQHRNADDEHRILDKGPAEKPAMNEMSPKPAPQARRLAPSTARGLRSQAGPTEIRSLSVPIKAPPAGVSWPLPLR